MLTYGRLTRVTSNSTDRDVSYGSFLKKKNLEFCKNQPDFISVSLVRWMLEPDSTYTKWVKLLMQLLFFGFSQKSHIFSNAPESNSSDPWKQQISSCKITGTMAEISTKKKLFSTFCHRIILSWIQSNGCGNRWEKVKALCICCQTWLYRIFIGDLVFRSPEIFF